MLEEEAASELLFTAAFAEVGLGAAARAKSLAASVGGRLGGGLRVQLGGAAAQLGEISWSFSAAGALAPAAAAGTMGVVFAKAVDPDRIGPKSGLPDIDGKAAASLKRASKKLEKAETDALKKALPRIDRARRELIEGLDRIHEQGGLVERSADNLEGARNALRDHATQADLTGALRDRVDLPVRQAGSGRAYDHAGECVDLLRRHLRPGPGHRLGSTRTVRGAPARPALEFLSQVTLVASISVPVATTAGPTSASQHGSMTLTGSGPRDHRVDLGPRASTKAEAAPAPDRVFAPAPAALRRRARPARGSGAAAKFGGRAGPALGGPHGPGSVDHESTGHARNPADHSARPH